MEKLVSVIMSTYNETESELSSSVFSILNQTYKNIEFIIINDNPNNDILVKFFEKISDNRIKIINNERNIGLVESLNRALKICHGSYIARMDADDISYYNRIHDQVVFLEKYNYDLVGSSVDLIDEHSHFLKHQYVPQNTAVLLRKLKRKNILPHPTWLGKRELFYELHGYRNIPSCEDYDFILRAMRQNKRIGCTNSVLLKYRIRSTSITQSNYSRQYVLSKYLKYAISQGETVENIEMYIMSDAYMKDVSEHKKFKKAKDNIKGRNFIGKDVFDFITSKYLVELLKDKIL